MLTQRAEECTHDSVGTAAAPRAVKVFTRFRPGFDVHSPLANWPRQHSSARVVAGPGELELAAPRAGFSGAFCWPLPGAIWSFRYEAHLPAGWPGSYKWGALKNGSSAFMLLVQSRRSIFREPSVDHFSDSDGRCLCGAEYSVVRFPALVVVFPATQGAGWSGIDDAAEGG